MRYMIIVITDLIKFALGVIGLVSILITMVYIAKDGFNYMQILIIVGGILFLTMASWMDEKLP